MIARQKLPQQALDRILNAQSRFVIESGCSFEVGSSPALANMVQEFVDVGYQYKVSYEVNKTIYSRVTVTDKIIQESKITLFGLANQLETALGIGICFDAWSAPTRVKYLGLICFFVDKHFSTQLVKLGLFSLDYGEKSDHVSRQVKELLQEYKILDKDDELDRDDELDIGAILEQSIEDLRKHM